MKKFMYILICLALLWVIKLSYDVYQTSGQLEQLQSDLHQSEQNNANLNDKIVAVQRQVVPETTTTPKNDTDNVPVNPAQAGISAVVLVRQQLELIQFAIQQQQYIYALEKINSLQQSLVQYEIADALKHSLVQALEKDKISVQQFVSNQHTRQEQFDDVLKQVDNALEQEINHQNLKPAKSESKYFWQKWFQFESVERPNAELMNRKLILKEVQLRILLAQQALSYGQVAEFKSNMEIATNRFKQLPDENSQKLAKQIEKLKHLPVLPTPKLNATALLG